jgi:hypothetical protein
MATPSSSLEQAARRAALRQTLENAMDVLDLTESQQQSQYSPSMMGLASGLNLGNMRQNPVLSRPSLHSSIPSGSSMALGNMGNPTNPLEAGLYGGNSISNNTFFPAATAEERLLARARSAFMQERIANEEQTRRMISNFLQSKQQHQQPLPNSQLYGCGPAQGSSETSTTSVIQALMGNTPGAGFPRTFMPPASSYKMFAPNGAPLQNPAQVSQKNDTAILHALGSNLRGKSTRHVDVSVMPDPEEDVDQRHLRGGVAEPFPEKLHRMLREAQDSGKGDIVSFYSHGRGFGIHDPEKFVEEILPTYFKQSKLNSFLRQLNLYGFVRIQSGPDSGGYYHELFLKQRPRFSRYMRRVGVPVKGEDRRKSKNSVVHIGSEPDFYEMAPVRKA